MRMSRLFTQTLRKAPADIERRGHALLLRAGFMQQLSAGVFAALPLAQQSIRRLESLACRVFDLLPAQQFDLPWIQSAELYGRGSLTFTDTLGRLQTLLDDDLPALSELVRGHIISYRQLPARLYRSASIWMDNPRPRGGWLNSRYEQVFTFYALLPHSGAASAEAIDQTAASVTRFMDALHLPARIVTGQPDLRAGSAREWHLPLPGGDDCFLACSACDYSASLPAARFMRPPAPTEPPRPLEKVATPHCPTIDSLARFLNLPASRTAKAVFLTADLPANPGEPPRHELLFAVVRGDRDVNEAALKRLTGAQALRPATSEEIVAVGAVPGYASPVGLKGVRVIVDPEVTTSPNLVSGANEAGYHLLNVNYGRDYTASDVAEIASACPGDACPRCGALLGEVESIHLATLMSFVALPACTYRDETGQFRDTALLRVNLSLYRLLACLAEVRGDERGLAWPLAAAPYPLHLVLLGSKTRQTETFAASLYEQLLAAELEPLFDDRAESPGVKFNDADLIGLPLRLTVSERAFAQGGVECKLRSGGDAFILPLENLLPSIQTLLANLS